MVKLCPLGPRAWESQAVTQGLGTIHDFRYKSCTTRFIGAEDETEVVLRVL